MKHLRKFNESLNWRDWWEEETNISVQELQEIVDLLGDDELDILNVRSYPHGKFDGENHFDSFEINIGLLGHFGMGQQKNYITKERFPIEKWRDWLKSFLDSHDFNLDYFYHTTPPSPGIRIMFSRKVPN